MNQLPTKTADPEEVLRIRELTVTFHTYAGDVKALDGVELSLHKREILGVVGESGCGKSVTALTITGLLPPNAEIVCGEALLNDVNLLKMKSSEMRLARLKDIAIVFQDPMTYMNPVMTIGSQITEILIENPEVFREVVVTSRLQEIDQLEKSGLISHKLQQERSHLKQVLSHGNLSKSKFRRLGQLYVLSYLRMVRLPEPERVLKMYPFELSGGMRQRAVIAMALIRKPKLLLADEITTALDVTVQAQILQLLMQLREQIDSSVVLITHDLAVVAEVCDRVAVMYAGNVVEVAEVNELFQNPLHPYTQGLLASIPRPDSAAVELKSIEGSVPDLISPPSGCRFHPRCRRAMDRCSASKPRPFETQPGHLVSCFLYGE